MAWWFVMFSFYELHYLLAHQGGWDEILWVLAPIAVMVWLLGVAARRIRSDAGINAENEAATNSTALPSSEANDVGPEN